jgi:hypothetical protein
MYGNARLTSKGLWLVDTCQPRTNRVRPPSCLSGAAGSCIRHRRTRQTEGNRKIRITNTNNLFSLQSYSSQDILNKLHQYNSVVFFYLASLIYFSVSLHLLLIGIKSLREILQKNGKSKRSSSLDTGQPNERSLWTMK